MAKLQSTSYKAPLTPCSSTDNPGHVRVEALAPHYFSTRRGYQTMTPSWEASNLEALPPETSTLPYPARPDARNFHSIHETVCQSDPYVVDTDICMQSGKRLGRQELGTD